MRLFVRALFAMSLLLAISACSSDEEVTTSTATTAAPAATTAAPAATTAAPVAPVVDDVCQGQDGSGLKVAYGEIGRAHV